MAQHISIKHYLNEEWLFNLIDQCKTIAWQYKEVENSSNYFKKISNDVELLPIEYACDYDKPKVFRRVNKVFNYKCNIDKPLTKEDDNLFISDCNVEIHLDKNKLVDIFIVA